MNKQKCTHLNCKGQATRVLRDNHNIYHYFCNEHFEIYRKLPCWTFVYIEDKGMQPLLKEGKTKEYGLKWTIWLRGKAELIFREKFFETDEQRQKFVAKLITNEQFNEILSYYDPK